MAKVDRAPYTSHPEITSPVSMEIKGSIPSWVNGKLVRIGPGLFEFGEHEAVLPMDGMGLLHAFDIQDSGVSFHSRFLPSDIYKKNTEANRFVAAEFGTPASPDPKKGRFSKLKDMVSGNTELSDNANHNAVYWKHNDVLLVPGLHLFVLDPKTLECREKVTLPGNLGIDLISEHMHVDKDGSLYLLGSHVRGRPTYNVVKVPPKEDVKASFAAAEIVFTVQGQYKVTPTSHHNFFMTENFFVVIEVPLEINILKILTKSTIRKALKWDPSVSAKFHVYNRRTGKAITQKIESDSFLFLHSPNAYEDGNHLVLDLFIQQRLALDTLFVERKIMAQPGYDRTAVSKRFGDNPPVRFIIPTSQEEINRETAGANLVKLSGEHAEAIKQDASIIRLKSRPLTTDDDLQYPCANRELAGKPYKYFYAGGCGESKSLQFAIGKFNVCSNEVVAWEAENQQYLTEPLFIPDPEGTAEDDGVLIFCMLDYAEQKDRLVVVDAKSMSTLAQVHFPGDSKILLPEADHGVFIPTA